MSADSAATWVDRTERVRLSLLAESESVPFGDASNLNFRNSSISSSSASAPVVMSLPIPVLAPQSMQAEEGSATERQWQRLLDPAYQPARTALGQYLRALRRSVIESGAELHDWDKLEKVMDQLRGR